MHTRTTAYKCEHFQQARTQLKIIDGEVMIGDEGFTQRSGVSEVKIHVSGQCFRNSRSDELT